MILVERDTVTYSTFSKTQGGTVAETEVSMNIDIAYEQHLELYKMKQSLPKLQCRSATVKKITTTRREPRRNRSKEDNMLQVSKYRD